MKLSTRIYIALIMSGLIITLASFLAIKSVKKMLIEGETFHETTLDSTHHMRSHMVEFVERSFAYLVSGNVDEKDEFLLSSEKFDQVAEKFASLARLTEPGEEVERELFEKIISGKGQLIQLANSAFEEKEKQGSVSRQTFDQYEHVIDTVKSDLQQLQEIEHEEVHNSQLLALQAIQNSRDFFIGIALLAIVMALCKGLWISRTMIQPMEKLGQAASKIGDRQFDIRLEVANPDEIGKLAESINEMAKKLKKTTATKEEAEVANKAKSQFLSHMSHEVRTPLNAIVGSAQNLLMNSSLSSRQQEVIKKIETNGNNLLELIDHILDITRIESGHTEHKSTNFNLTSLIQGLAIMFKERCESKRLKFNLNGLGQESIYVHGDEGKLRQVLVNLLGNAVKFTDEGEVSLKIEKVEDHNYIFKVIDTGAGISSADKIKIFQSFMQAEAGSHRGGTGLGLSISKEMVELMGGKLLLDSQAGKGSCFSVFLHLPPMHPD